MTANLNKGYVDKDFLDYRAQNIFGTSSLISIRLNSYDFHVNPNALASGTGLHFAKLVCDLHSVGISARSQQQEKFKIKGVPYSYFSVTLEITLS